MSIKTQHPTHIARDKALQAKNERLLADSGLVASQLDDKYNPDGGGEQPDYPRREWVNAVQNEETIVGYWDWVEYQIEQWVNNQEQVELSGTQPVNVAHDSAGHDPAHELWPSREGA